MMNCLFNLTFLVLCKRKARVLILLHYLISITHQISSFFVKIPEFFLIMNMLSLQKISKVSIKMWLKTLDLDLKTFSLIKRAIYLKSYKIYLWKMALTFFNLDSGCKTKSNSIKRKISIKL